MGDKRSWIKYGVVLCVFVVAILAYVFTPLGDVLSVDSITMFVSSFGMFAPVVFMVLYIVLLLFLFPATILSVIGGVLFGTFWGVVYVVIAATIAASVGFLLARMFRGNDESRFNNAVVQKLVGKCEEECEKHGFRAFFILRLLYLPYMPLSYAGGLVKSARFRDFLIATFLTNIVGSFSFVYLGGSLSNGFGALLIPLVLIVLTLLIPKVVKYVQK